MKNFILSKILLHVESFPGLPKTGVKLMGVLDEPNASFAQIEKILNYDPGLTANFLKLANSPYFGIPSKVSSVKQAITLLGINRLKQIVLATSTSAVLDKAVPGYDLQPG
jgi:HD-like signal output (HDOD) protein